MPPKPKNTREKIGEKAVTTITCPCKRTKCPRYGDCSACREYHHNHKHKKLTYCEKLREKE